MSIRVTEVTKKYGEQKALDNVSFEVKAGEIAGFIGPNGAGKSTMMKIITGYILPTSGDVWVDSRNVSENAMEVKKTIGYLPESNPLYYDMYVREYLRFVGSIYTLDVPLKQRVEEIIELTGLQAEKHKKIGMLSKGYKQRVGIAQALIHDPQVLILDEPTSGLDPNQILDIRDLISGIGKKKTILLSTHIMQEVEAICNRIIIIHNGQIAADDKTENISTYSAAPCHTLLVEFNKPVEIESLQQIEGVNKVLKIEGNNWLIQTPDNMDIRDKIFNYAVNQSIVVLSMQKKEQNLEQVFQELTK